MEYFTQFSGTIIYEREDFHKFGPYLHVKADRDLFLPPTLTFVQAVACALCTERPVRIPTRCCVPADCASPPEGRSLADG